MPLPKIEIAFAKREDLRQSLGAYTTFNSVDKFIWFDLKQTQPDERVTLAFIVKRDTSKDSFLTEWSSDPAKGTLTVIYYNPGPGSSGPLSPAVFADDGKHIFSAMFYVEMSHADYYKLTIEFFIEESRK